MSYDPNSLEAKKGALGERIVKEYLEASGNWKVEKTPDSFASGASIVDFLVTPVLLGNGEPKLKRVHPYFVEVKTQIAKPYGVEKALCYSFPKSRIEAYTQYERHYLAQKMPLLIYIVDPSAGLMFMEFLYELEQPCCIDGRNFPFDKTNKPLGGIFHYWHQKQFAASKDIAPEALAELRKLFENEKDIPKDNEPQAVELPTCTGKDLADKFAAFVNVGKEDLIQAVLDLRQKKFDREQAQMKELLS